MTSAPGVNCSEKSVSLQSTVLGTLLFIALWSNRVPVEPDKRGQDGFSKQTSDNKMDEGREDALP